MASTGSRYFAAANTIAGSRITITGQSASQVAATDVTIVALSAAIEFDVMVTGTIHGFLRFPFADPETLEGALMPADAKTCQIKLTQGGADAVLVLLCEEVYAN